MVRSGTLTRIVIPADIRTSSRFDRRMDTRCSTDPTRSSSGVFDKEVATRPRTPYGIDTVLSHPRSPLVPTLLPRPGR